MELEGTEEKHQDLDSQMTKTHQNQKSAELKNPHMDNSVIRKRTRKDLEKLVTKVHRYRVHCKPTHNIGRCR